MIELGSVEEGSSLIDELMELTSQSLCQLEIKEHFNIIKEIGRGKYGHVLLVTHRCKGTLLSLYSVLSHSLCFLKVQKVL